MEVLFGLEQTNIILSATNQEMSMAVTFLPSLFLSGSIISSKLVRLWGTRVLGVIGGFLVILILFFRS